MNGPWRKLLLSALVAIVVPVMATEALEEWYGVPEPWEWLLHSVILMTTLTPVFFLLWYRPLAAEMAERRRAGEEVRRLSRQAMEAGEEERRRLARDLHDDIGQRLVALKMQVDLHRQQLADRHPELAEPCLQISNIVCGLADDLRQVIVALRPPLLDDLGLLPALEAHLSDLRNLCPTLEVRLLASGLSGRLPAEIETVLFRVCQEALSNVLRHARARQVQVRLTGSYPSVILIVEDDGVGFPITAMDTGDMQGYHYGLSGIRERVTAVGGTLLMQSAPAKGTRLRVEVPVAAKG